MAHHPEGIEATDLSDTILARELATLHATRHETFLEATDDALAAHTKRMLLLEGEYLRRFPDRDAPHPLRTRSGSRAAAGQD
ncbi:MAG TPA: DUF6158 family protein [Frankiaceae bacterium]|jgi:hypothetical protein|nr:DUF6158 family protein [Frankiaceae bacterium]